ncbi:hypothetical protein ACEWAO_23570, partial [Vibrio parahaemolyticus]
WQIYSLNLFMIGLSLFFLNRYIGNPKRNLSELAHDRLSKKYAYMRSLSVASIFLLGAVFAGLRGHFFYYAARYIYILIPFVLSIINRAANKRIAK